jgi:integrase
MTGIRTEEARALRWDHVDLDAASIAVWRSVRLGRDTKTSKSRRTLGLPQAVTEALRAHRVRQAEEKVAAGDLWREHNLVFTTAVGTELDAANFRRSFRSICKAVGVGEGWTPRELRTSFVSLLSVSGVPVEEIARLAGYSSSRTTEVIYRKELRPVLVNSVCTSMIPGRVAMDDVQVRDACQIGLCTAVDRSAEGNAPRPAVLALGPCGIRCGG